MKAKHHLLDGFSKCRLCPWLCFWKLARWITTSSSSIFGGVDSKSLKSGVFDMFSRKGNSKNWLVQGGWRFFTDSLCHCVHGWILPTSHFESEHQEELLHCGVEKTSSWYQCFFHSTRSMITFQISSKNTTGKICWPVVAISF